MCAPTPLGSANPGPPTSGLRKLRALSRAGAAHNRALVARATFDSNDGFGEVGRRGNGPTGEALVGSRLKPETRPGQKGIWAMLESPTGRSEKGRARRVPHRWAAEVAVTLQGAEGDWRPWHQGDNPWVAGQLKPVTAGANPAVRKAETPGRKTPDTVGWQAGCALVFLGGRCLLATSGHRKPDVRFGEVFFNTPKGNTPARRMYGLANAGSSQRSGWQPLWFLEPGNGPRFRALADPGRCPRGRRAGDWASRLEDGRTRTREVGLRPSEGQHPAESPEQARSPRGDRRRYLARGQCRR